MGYSMGKTPQQSRASRTTTTDVGLTLLNGETAESRTIVRVSDGQESSTSLNKDILLVNCAVTKLHRWRCPNISSYTEQGNHLHSTIFRWRQVKYSCDTSSFTLSRGLVPPFWSLVLISLAVTSAVYAPSSWITWGSLVDPPLHWVLCRWLAGVYQRITTPLFYSVNFLNP